MRAKWIAVLLLSACSADEDKVDTTQQAETVCDVSRLAWNLQPPSAPQTCAGPWHYHQKYDCSVHRDAVSCTEDGNPSNPQSCSVLHAPASTITTPTSPACPETGRAQNSTFVAKSCSWASTYDYNAEHKHEVMTYTSTKTCSKYLDGDCVSWKTTNTPTETCDQHAQKKVNMYHPPYYMGGADGTASFGGWVVYANPVTSALYCDYDLYNVPTNYHYGPDTQSFTICGGSMQRQADTVYYGACDNPGLPPTYLCGSTGDMFTGWGAAGVTDPKLQGQTECLTDENNALTNGPTLGSDVQGKYGRLYANYTKATNHQFTGGDASSNAFTAADNDRLAGLLEANLKLLFESYGEYLTPEQRANIIAIYAADGTAPACGVTYTPPTTASCDLQDKLPALDRVLTMCTRLESQHVHAVKDQEDVVDACIAAADQIAPLRTSFIANGGVDDGARPPDGTPLATECGFLGYRELWNELVSDPLATRFEKLIDLKNNATQDTPEAQARMRLLSAWYTSAEKDLYPFASTSNGSDLTDPLVRARWRETSKLGGAFWRGIYRQLYVMADQYAAGSGSGSAAIPDATDIEAAAHDTLDADRAVLGLLYPPAGRQPPLTGAPLLMLTSDALTAMSHRLQDTAVYHDMGCTYLGCANGTHDSETSYLYRFFANTASANGLAQVITAANTANAAGSTVVRPEWLTIFTQLAAQHGAFEQAVCDAANVPAASCDAATYAALETALENAPTSLSAPVTPLASIVQDAIGRWSSYTKSGLLDPSARNRLASGIQQSQIDGVLTDLRTTSSDLETKTGRYSTAMQQLAASYLTDIAQQNKVSDTEAQIASKVDAIKRQVSDIGGLRAKIDRDRDLFGTFVDSYKTVQDVNGNALVGTEPLGTFQMSAQSARATSPLDGGDVSRLLAAPTKYTVAKGDILHIGVTGNWSPNCMIQSTQGSIVMPGNQTSTINYTSDPLIGPEGFTVSLSNGIAATHANTVSQTDTTQTGNSVEGSICAGVRATIGPNVGWYSVQGYVDISACAKLTASSSSATATGNTTTSSNSASSSIATSSGLRLPNTPFPDQPAGSVVLVYTPPNDPRHILRTEVVLREYATIAPADADVYIVDNDINTGGCTLDGSNALTLTVERLQTSSTAAANVKTALTNVLDTINSQADAFVAQGSFSAADQTSLRSAAISAISSSTGCNCDFNTYPDPVKNFFYAWIDHEIATIDKKVQIYNLQRATNALMLDYEALSQDLIYADKAGHIAAMTPAWSLRNLDMEMLRTETRRVLVAMTYELYPILKLRFPTIFANLAAYGDLQANITSLVNAHWDEPVDNLAQYAYLASQDLLTATASIGSIDNNFAYPTVALQFTRPAAAKYTQVPLADDARAAQIWAQITTPPHIATFSIRPEDLYRTSGGSALLCNLQAPVIRDMAIVVTGQDSDTTARFDPIPWYAPVTVSPTMQFPLARQFDQVLQTWVPGTLASYGFADAGWQAQVTQILFADTAQTMFSKMDAKRPEAGAGTLYISARGISPFAQFTVDFGSFYTPDKLVGGIQPLFDTANPTRAKQVSLVMRLEARPNAPTLDFLTTCH